MLARSQSRSERRGIVLVLVLAMLGLLALVGVTFATFSGQERINSRNFALSLIQPQDDELMDFALSQLINDTGDPRSVIRGHSMARDMFGTGSASNGALAVSPTTGLPFHIIEIQPATTLPLLNVVNAFTLTTDIAQNDLNFYGFNFTRWIMRVSYAGPLTVTGTTASVAGTGTVNQTIEIISDSGFSLASNAGRQFQAFIIPTDGQPIYGQANGQFANPPTGPTGPAPPALSTVLYNPTLAPNIPAPINSTPAFLTQLPGAYLITASLNGNNQTSGNLGTNFPFQLDGRWLHAFNGPGMGATSTTYTVGTGANTTTISVPNSTYGNFRLNGALLSGTVANATFNFPGNPNTFGMDEDYDACDLENWFLAIQSADGQVMIPSFHRPAIIRSDAAINFPNAATINDWQNINPLAATNPVTAFADSASRILRPRMVDGNSGTSFPDLVPNHTTGQITYDVDNDGDGLTDSVWLDLGYPVRRDSRGSLYKPLFAFMVIGLNGRIPLNTAGNLAGTVAGMPFPPGTAPTNTVSAGPGHSLHLGNSTSEIDPMYALQNGFNPNTDSAFTFTPFTPPILRNLNGTNPGNSQTDSGGIDVRLTQLRNLLAGTRPQTNPLSPATTPVVTNGDIDFVLSNGGSYFMPNGIADSGDLIPPAGTQTTTSTDANGNIYVSRLTPSVPGRWGEAESIPSGPGFANPFFTTGATAGTPTSFQFVNMPSQIYQNPVRAGYSQDAGDVLNGTPRDAADDNFNSFDPYPAYDVATGSQRIGELGDLDSYDVTGALLLPVERMRRWLTPADINGTGTVSTWSPAATAPNRGADSFGRVEFTSYFRPPGSPGVISTNYTGTAASGLAPTVTDGTNLGAIYFPSSNLTTSEFSYLSGPANGPPYIATPLVPTANAQPYLPDMTNNPLHGFESFRFPNQAYHNTPTAFHPQQLGGSPVGGITIPEGTNYDLNHIPILFPTYDSTVNASVNSDGLNEADEMNLYQRFPLLDSPFGPPDLEWLYRQQDVDGASLTSRLSTLAPISFTNPIDGARRRKLVAIESWDLTNFVWANDNPQNAFPSNSRFTNTQSAGFVQLSTNLSTPRSTPPNIVSVGTPTLAQRDKKINLNFPLPVSNDPNEPIRLKWINDTYQLLKNVLPPKAVDTPEELAQLSQFVINIIDYRDPDCTMTHWVNPDVMVAGVLVPPAAAGPTAVPATSITLLPAGVAPPATVPATTTIALDQYGMEYNPVALNEVLAYSYVYVPSGSTAVSRANKFCIELVNTMTSPELWALAGATPPVSPFNPALSLGGFSQIPSPPAAPTDPYMSGAWDVVFTADDPYSRPDPYRGQLVPFGNTFGLTPLDQDGFNPGGGGAALPVTLPPLSQGSAPGVTPPTPSIPVPILAGGILPNGATAAVPYDYFYAFGNVAPSPANEQNSPSPTQPFTLITNGSNTAPTTTNYYVLANTPTLTQTLLTTRDPFNASSAAAPPTSPIPIYEGTLPVQTMSSLVTPTAAVPNPSTTMFPINYQPTIPTFPITSASADTTTPLYYWACLRRPANPFAPVSAANPMVVVDSMRFPYIEATAKITGKTMSASGVAVPDTPPALATTTGGVATPGNADVAYSAQRFQPYRGGHALPIPQTTPSIPSPVDTRYGYSEQTVVPGSSLSSGAAVPSGSLIPNTQGIYYIDTTVKPPKQFFGTLPILHTIGWANEYEQGSFNSLAENWDYFPFLDRDYTSVAELLLVPGCSPGLFTKQFVEFAPSFNNITNVFSQVTPLLAPTINGPSATGGTTAIPPAVPTAVQAYNTGSTPLAAASTPNFYSNAFLTGTPAPTPTGEPHTFPYLIDKFFYSGYGAANTLDPGGLVGGYAADGWFKMFDFFEVPSQMIGAIGPVAQGNNFDWARQDTKPGQLNLNLIIDEEVFFSLVGRQTITQTNGQLFTTGGTTPAPGTAVYPSDQFTQTNLNFDQIIAGGILPGTLGLGGTMDLPAGNYVPGGNNPNVAGNVAPWMLPLAQGTPPIPMVVTSTLFNGAAASAYPIWNPSATYGGLLAADPTYNFILGTSNLVATGLAPQYTNALKASWIQFLWLRHGGSGYIFGFGNGAVGQNVSVATNGVFPGANGVTPLTNTNTLPTLPAEIPFHSLSFPDIDHTIMRPAALPPGVAVPPGALADPPTATAVFYTLPDANPLPGTPAAMLYGTAAPGAGVTTPWQNPATYATIPLWNTFTGDPGVRNYWLYAGYPSASLELNTGLLPTNWTMNVPNFRGYPGAAAPAPPSPTAPNPPNALAPPVDTYWPVYPPPIPVRRLFQVPDNYHITPYALPGPPASPLSPSNAGETGDPSLNFLVPLHPAATVPVPIPAAGALPPINYTFGTAGTQYGVLTGSVADLYWPGANAARLFTGATPAVSNPVPLPGGASHFLGSSAAAAGAGGPARADARQHPYWRTEHLQRIMNQTTVRTHQYAVWITVGFFEVTKQGDIAMLSSNNPQLAFDIMGSEVGAVTGNTIRYRSFFLIDRTKITGFNTSNTGSFRAAVVYRRVIQ
jgi:large repetitive protein